MSETQVPTASGHTASTTGSPREPDVLGVGQAVGRYIVVSRRGSGGMGVVYSAYDPELDRKVALKVIRPRVVRAEVARARFIREARAMARVSHRGVVPIYDAGTFGDSVFLAMELVDGANAAEWLREAQPPWRRAVGTLLEAGRGLAAAHAAGIVHRDVKPANVLVGRDGIARVSDFGLARTDTPGIDLDAGETRAEGDDGLTRPGAILGTPAYMAPEQHQGRPADARSDQFSFCMVLYEAVYGERPFTEAAEVTGGRVRAAPRGTRVPAWLRRILLRGLAVDPDARWPSMDALVAEIEETPRRRRRPALVSGIVIAVAAAAGAFTIGRANPAGREDPCGTGAERLAVAWAPRDRAAALARIATLGPYGQSIAARLGPRIDDYVGRWARGHRDACVAHRDGVQSDALLDRRMACLERSRAALATVAEIVDGADRKALPDTVLAVEALPDLQACSDVDALLTAAAPPPRAQAAAVDATAARVERARVLVAAGRYADGEREAAAAVADARQLAYRPLLAQALTVEGHAAMNAGGDQQRTPPMLSEAARTAVEVGDDSLAVEAWARRTWVLSSHTHADERDLFDGLELVNALAARPTSSRFARALLYNNLGAAQHTIGHLDQARTWFERAVREAEGVVGPGAVELVNTRGNLALIVADPGERDALFAGAVSTLERLVGADHPQTMEMVRTRARWRTGAAEAAALLAPACERYDQIHGEDAVTSPRCWLDLAFLADHLDDRAKAIDAMARAARGAAAAEANAYLALWRGEAAAATDLFAAALAATTRRPDARHWELRRYGRLELGLGRARRAVGDLRGARASLDEAVADLTAAAQALRYPPDERLLARARSELTGLEPNRSDSR